MIILQAVNDLQNNDEGVKNQMTKKLTKAVLGLAVTAAIGAGAIGANAFFVSSALAADTNQQIPVITADTAPVETGPENTATVVSDGNGNQTIISEQDRIQLEKDLAAKVDKNSDPTFVAGTPSENDLPEEQAVELAKNSVDNEFALTEETWSKFSTNAVLNVADPEAPVWSITFYPTNQNDFSQIGTYNVTIDSRSDEIIKIMSAADGVG